jgi:serine protease AprX
MAKVLSVFLAVLLIAVPVLASDIAPSVRVWMEAVHGDETIAVWVFFRDKGPLPAGGEQAALRDLAGTYPARTVERRLRARPGQPFDKGDLPLCRPYVQSLKAIGVDFRAFSRWLNAVSVEASADKIRQMADLDFVSRVARVSGRRGFPQPETYAQERPAKALDQYGASYTQLAQIQVTDLQSEGYTGAGVVVAIFDTGFWLEHESIAGTAVVAEHDFINDDDVTANEPGDDPSQHNHGTSCLSLLAGNTPGIMLGAAYDAQYILAKTEDTTMEEPVEEDWWIEAAEWADSLGAQVVSSSLCYNDWYTYEDMDGQTAPITIAADRAAVYGIVVANAAGNSGASEWRYILAPADGDSVVSVGAVDSTGNRAYFSSMGPTYDGRIKPTIMAMGQSDFIADPLYATGYRRGSGTSFACPLVAGAAALILQKNPGWTSAEVMEAMVATGTRATDPDTLYGWGILQALDASNYDPVSGITSEASLPVLFAYPNPCKSRLTIRYPSRTPLSAPVLVYDVRGRLLEKLSPDRPGEVSFNPADIGPGLSPGLVFVVVPGVGKAKVLFLE